MNIQDENLDQEDYTSKLKRLLDKQKSYDAYFNRDLGAMPKTNRRFQFRGFGDNLLTRKLNEMMRDKTMTPIDQEINKLKAQQRKKTIDQLGGFNVIGEDEVPADKEQLLVDEMNFREFGGKKPQIQIENADQKENFLQRLSRLNQIDPDMAKIANEAVMKKEQNQYDAAKAANNLEATLARLDMTQRFNQDKMNADRAWDVKKFEREQQAKLDAPTSVVSAVDPKSGQPVYLPPSKAVGMRPYSASTDLDVIRGKGQIENEEKEYSKFASALASEKERFKSAKSTFDAAQQLLESGVPTGGAFGKAVDSALGVFNISTPGAKASASLSALGNRLASFIPRYEGPQSNFDVEGYMAQVGLIQDASQPVDTRKAALQTARKMLEDYYGNVENALKNFRSTYNTGKQSGSGQLQPGQSQKIGNAKVTRVE